jgi:hypothetical protein
MQQGVIEPVLHSCIARELLATPGKGDKTRHLPLHLEASGHGEGENGALFPRSETIAPAASTRR